MGERIVPKEKLFTAIQNAGHSERVILALRKRGWIKYIFQGYYYVLTPEEKVRNYVQYSATEMLSVVLNKLKVKWYFGLQSALAFNGITWQGHSTLIILNNKFSGVRTVQGTRILFRKMQPKYFFGTYTKEAKNRITFYYSDGEKTLLDFAYFAEKYPYELKEKTNTAKLQVYLRNYSSVVRKRVLL
jgi:predicted transcriptional regulator of viral defense system